MLYKTRARTWRDLEVQAGYVFQAQLELDPVVLAEISVDALAMKGLQSWIDRAQSMSFDNHAELEKMTRELADQLTIKPAVLIHPLRFALSGTKITPGLFELMSVMGKELCLERIHKLIRATSKTV